jgi:hypothetical protein
MEEIIIVYLTENTITVSNHKVIWNMYYYIHMFREGFCGLPQPLQTNTGHLLHKHYGHFLMHQLQMIFHTNVLRSKD